MNVTKSSELRLASRLVNGLSRPSNPLHAFAKHQARTMMIKRAESIGVAWTQGATALRDRGESVWEAERQALETPGLNHPDYYLSSFHAYETGNLSWEAATEVEFASYAVHARIWPEAGAQGDAKLRQSYHDQLQKYIATAEPQDILGYGLWCRHEYVCTPSHLSPNSSYGFRFIALLSGDRPVPSPDTTAHFPLVPPSR